MGRIATTNEIRPAGWPDVAMTASRVGVGKRGHQEEGRVCGNTCWEGGSGVQRREHGSIVDWF